jgi:hypothetical protein
LKKILLLGIAFFLFYGNTWATHIRAGEITLELINCATNTYLITITGYTDTRSTVQFGGGELDFGDGSPKIEFLEGSTQFSFKRNLGRDVAVTQFVVEHTFPGPGWYTLRFFERNRNGTVINMSNSVNTPFYIETRILIDPLIGCNNTPVMEIPPIDRACVGKMFIHNPGAYDVDGDSISYEIVKNKKAFNTLVDNYRFPNDPSFNGKVENGQDPATFSIDSDGNLIWNSPGTQGEYNLAFLIKEWRQVAPGVWKEIGRVTRDMQVIVEGDCMNQKPELIVPMDTCIEAGTLLKGIIVGTDPDGDQVLIESFGEAFTFLNNPAIVTPEEKFRPQPDTVHFSWQTSCDMIRQEPYRFTFKITDKPANDGTPLNDIKIWNVSIVGPKPKGLSVTNQPGGAAEITWNPYECVNATAIQVWRRVDSHPFEPDNCETGLPANSGYELVGEVDQTSTSFYDDNDGKRLTPGATYCYRLVGIFNNGVESYVSDEFCISTVLDAPVITNVSVLNTDVENGEILVKWLPPLEINQALFPPPYYYEVYRGAGFSGTNRVKVTANKIAQTEFIDRGINTQEQVYNYMIYLYDAADRLVDSSAVASSVRLGLASLIGSIELGWTANTPWSNSSAQHPWHFIYRDNVDPANPGALVKIDSVNVLRQGFIYLDDGSATNLSELSEDIIYCYFVTTSGSYGNAIIPTPLLNDSQISCARPNDTIPPCEPLAITFSDFNSPDECEEYIKNQPCWFDDFSNTLTWTADLTGDCDQEIRGFKIFFSESGAENSFIEIAEVTDTFYVHRNLSSFAGCYRVAAVDRSGNLSTITDPICKDNCPVYVLPNVFTPNDDGTNDLFAAITRQDNDGSWLCPRFVESVKFKVYNRWGVEVYNSELDSRPGEFSIMINWDGRNNSGIEVPTGVYYYTAEIKYQALNPNRSTYEMKGWVHILR